MREVTSLQGLINLARQGGWSFELDTEAHKTWHTLTVRRSGHPALRFSLRADALGTWYLHMAETESTQGRWVWVATDAAVALLTEAP